MEVSVLIVGAGPSGATLALLLAKQNVKCLVISKHKGTANTPRAHIFNQRAMEVLRDAGLQDKVESLASPASAMAHTSWLNSLAGEEYGRLWSWGNDPARKGHYESASPCSMCDLPQSLLEPILVEEAMSAGAQFRFYTEFLSLRQDKDQVITTFRDRHSREISTISSMYLVGADGARSSVLDALNIPISGRQINDAFNVHIKADLSKYLSHRPGSLNWILNPDAPDWSAVGNFRMVRPWTEFVVSMHPSSRDGAPFEPQEEDILKRLYQMIGDESIPVEIMSTYKWSINDQIALRWQDKRCLCIGDATHRHPPINGLGSNTCVSDAFNLAWKLVFVLKNWAGSRLLDSLTIERKPIGDAIVKRANEGMEVHRNLWNILGLTKEDRQKAIETLKSASIDGAMLRTKFREALTQVDDEVQAIGIQMNQVYSDSPAILIDDGDNGPDLSEYSFLKDVFISTFPGYHLPHLWLAKDGQSEKISILDLAGHGYFTIFTGIGGFAWLQAANCFAEETGIPLKGYSIGFGCDYLDAYQDWDRLCGTGEDGAVLVRPDHFVAWRTNGLSEGHLERLQSVFQQILFLA